MTRPLRRLVAFALLSTLSIVGARSIPLVVVGYLAVGVGAAFVTDGPLFELLSTPADRREDRLRTVIAMSLAAAGIGSLVEILGLPVSVFVATMLTLGYGDLGKGLLLEFRESAVWGTAGFVGAAGSAGFLGQVAVAFVHGWIRPDLFPEYLFLAVSAALLGALLRSVMFERSDPLVLGLIVLLLWLFADLAVAVDWPQILIALALTFVLGYLSFAMGTASIPGMLTGVFLSLLALVLGGYGWFVVLMAFFAVGGLSTKYRYEEKRERGIAEANEGARGTGNVLGNSVAALSALLLFAAHAKMPVPETVFVVAFAGSVATALADTLSSEIGGLYDRPRLITNLAPVEPGTDGAITWQGEVAGALGAGIIATLSLVLLPIGVTGTVIVVVSGMVGMTADSLAGATIEGEFLGNQSVNFIATSIGALAGGVLAGLLLV